MDIHYSRNRETFNGCFYRFTAQKILDLTRDVMVQLKQLNKHQIIHNDIKPENIVFDLNTGKWRLIDFDLSIKLKNGSKTGGYCGSFLFSAPEIQKRKTINMYTNKCDVWSLGLTITGLMPAITIVSNI